MTKHAGRFRLSDMEFDFVSLVLAGDDPMARVVIAKAEPHKSGDAGPPASTLPISKNDLLEDQMPQSISKDGLAPEVVTYIDGLEAENDVLAAQVEKSETDMTARSFTMSGGARRRAVLLPCVRDSALWV